MAITVYPSGSTLSSTGRERHNEERVRIRMCALDSNHDDDLPFAAVIATTTSPAHATREYPRGRWQSCVPLGQECADRLRQGMPFGYFMGRRSAEALQRLRTPYALRWLLRAVTRRSSTSPFAHHHIRKAIRPRAKI